MRIGFDAKRAFSNRTGLGNYSRFIIQTLSDHVNTCECILFAPKQKNIHFHELERLPNITCIYPKNFIWKKTPSLWRSFKMGEIISNQDLDVFHGLSAELPFDISKFKGKKIVSIHDLIFLRYPHYYSAIDRQIYDYKCRYACKKADVIIAISEQTKQDIIQYYKIPEQKIEVVYQDCNPIFRRKYSLNENNSILKKYSISENYILSVGTLEKRKNQFAILKSFALLKNTDLQLIFVGRGASYKIEMQNWLGLQANELKSRVLFLENIPTAELPALYQSARTAIYMSEFEGFGIPILEALRSGCPVLANNGSSLKEVGGPAISYSDASDIIVLSDAINDICRNETLRNQLMLNKDLHLNKFDPAFLAQQLISIYTQ